MPTFKVNFSHELLDLPSRTNFYIICHPRWDNDFGPVYGIGMSAFNISTGKLREKRPLVSLGVDESTIIE